MSVIATPSVHALLRDLAAHSPRRHYLDDPEGIELSNQSALVRSVVATVQACLDRDLSALRASACADVSAMPDRIEGTGTLAVAAVAQYEEILATLLDAAMLLDAGRTGTVWTVLAAATHRLRTLDALRSDAGIEVASQLGATSTHAQLTLAAALDTVDGELPDVASESVGAPTTTLLPVAQWEVANLVALVDLGVASGIDGTGTGTTVTTDFDRLTAIGGCQALVALGIVGAATDALCALAATCTTGDTWPTWAADVRAGVEFAWSCV